MKLKKTGVLFVIFFIFFSGSLLNSTTSANIGRTESLSVLCKVWGFLKYYHPEVTSGHYDWDEVLIAAIPKFSTASDNTELNNKIIELIKSAGGINYLDYGETFPDTQISDSNFAWMEDHNTLDWYTYLLLKILKSNKIDGTNHYVKFVEYVGNPVFDNEKPYSDYEYPGENERLLALFRYWNIIHYFFPYKDVIGENWEDVLEEFIPQVIDSQNALEYNLVMRKFTARINDGHASFRSITIDNYWGVYFPPFDVRYIENEYVITRVYDNLNTSNADIYPGDIIIGFDGQNVDELRDFTLQYMAASNEARRHYNAGYFMFSGSNKKCSINILRDGIKKAFTLDRHHFYDLYAEEDRMAGEKWKILPGNIGYINMGLIMPEDVDPLMTNAELLNTKGIIFDLRNYPNSTLSLVGKYLLERPVQFSKFKKPDPGNPGSFTFSDFAWVGPSGTNENYYKGKVVILVDERSVSRSEFICMAFQIIPNATTIGSQTAGADGNVSRLSLPGGIRTGFSGIGVFYSDGTPTQRVGVKIDHTIRPTISGIRQGRDEILEFAVNFIKNQ